MPSTTAARRVGTGLTSLAATAAVIVLAAPSAQATVKSVTISGSDHVVGTSYTLEATVGGISFGLPVTWTANGVKIGGPKVPWPPGKSTQEWTPESPGQHIITATQGSSTESIVVDVTKPGGSSGSANTGSADGILGNLLG
ncbi:hypothetical protein ACL02S_20555 [Nocardia sp. 004]|uniref:hypothetical protein n=1 Tax=Nocardia sp. 004 TaxID=3385978 RepID=UPI0039A2A98E